MDASDYGAMRRLYHELAELSPDEQRRRLSQLHEEDEIRVEVEGLLRHEPRIRELQEEHLGSGVQEALLGDGRSSPPQVEPPETIGDYDVLERIGGGGMGTVYRCEQSRPRRQVAIKVLDATIASPDASRRFQYEAEILGGLDHRFIAKVIELGIDPSNDAPFLVMELVDGVDLMTHCDQEGLGTRARVELFRDICEGVAHAHQSGVVHRDLKPANILISTDGRPCIIDFGIARPIAGVRGPTSDRSDAGDTRTGSVLGSLQWMSPEQASGDVARHDTRTDVYSLGVILYRLLSGEMPYAIEGMLPWEAAQVLARDVPRPLRAYDRSLRGDLEAIVARALEAEPDERYPTAAALEADVDRYLSGLPVEARPWSTAYHVQKLARRHWAIAVALLGLLVTLVAGVIVGFLLWRGAESARRDASYEASVAQRKTEVSRRVVNYITEMFGEVQRENVTGESVTVKSVLDRAVADLYASQLGDPLLEAELFAALGNVYAQLGLFGDAIPLLRNAEELLERGADDDLPETRLDNEILLTGILWESGEHEEAADRFKELIPRTRESHGPTHGRTLQLVRTYAGLLSDTGEYEAARELLDPTIAGARAERGDRDEATLSLIAALVVVLLDEQRWEEAEPLAREAYEGRLEVLGPSHFLTSASGNSLAQLYMEIGDVESAEPIARAVVSAMEDALAPSHPYVLLVTQNLANLYLRAGRYDRSDEIYSDVITRLEASLGVDHQDTLRARHGRARLWLAQGRIDDAHDELLDVLVLSEEALGEDHPDVVELFLTLARLQSGRSPEDVEACLLEAVERSRSGVGRSSPRTLGVLGSLVDHLVGEERWSDAIEVMGDTLNESSLDPGLGDERVQWLLVQETQCLLELDETERASDGLRRLESLAGRGQVIDDALAELRQRLSQGR